MANWLDVGPLDRIEPEGVIRVDHGGRTYAVFRSPHDEVYCTAGLCTHEAVHLADGFVCEYEVECPKHQGAFDYRTGEPLRLPPCVELQTFAARIEGGRVLIDVA